jgi:hypothetical protein
MRQWEGKTPYRPEQAMARFGWSLALPEMLNADS